MKNIGLLLLGCLMSTGIHAMSSLHKAVAFLNDAHRVDELIKSKADVNVRDKWERTPLMYLNPGPLDKPYAPLSIAKLLVEHGASVNARDKNGRTPLHWLANQVRQDLTPDQVQGITQVISYLVEQGADVNATIAQTYETPLFKGILSRNVFIVRELLKTPETDLTMKPEPGNALTPLKLARSLALVVIEAQEIVDMLEKVQQFKRSSVQKLANKPVKKQLPSHAHN